MADCFSPSARRTLACFCALGGVDGRLLLALGLQDGGALLLVGLLLQGHGVHDVLGRDDVDDLDPVEPDAPLLGGRGHVGLELGVDALALAQGLVEGHPAEDGPQGGAGQLVDGHVVLADLVEGQADVDHLAEDGGVHEDAHVVLGDDGLEVAESRLLAHVDADDGVDEGHEEGHARVGGSS